MNFQLAKIGHSFKGSMAYYLHDKRQEGERYATTDERVAWTETRNLVTDGAHTATRIMIATAQQADALKEAAGVKTTGRKATAGPVLAFSLQWRADELPTRDRAEMVRAADHALKVLKLDHLQAVLVCHQDEPHPHVHVIVNRIDPTNGKATPIRAPDVKALDRWANQYEQDRGQVVSPNRAKKYEAQEKKRQQHPDAERRKRHIEQRNAERAAQRKERQGRGEDQKARSATDTTPAGMLKDLGDAQRARHRQEWAQLAGNQQRRRQAIYDAAGRHIRDELARAKDQNRPLWSELHRDQREARKRFEQRERHLAGIVRNCIAAAKLQERHGEPSARGFLSMAFAYVGNRDARRQTFTDEQQRQRQRFAAELKAGTDARVAAIQQVRGETLAKARAKMADERAGLITRQNAEREKVREAWRQLNQQRGRMPARPQREKPIMREFDDAAKKRSPWATDAPVQPTKQQAIATPAPAPAPAGMPQPPARTVQTVPAVDQAAAWAKTEAGRVEMQRHGAGPSPVRDQHGAVIGPSLEEHRRRRGDALHKIAAEHGFSATARPAPARPEQQAAPAAPPQQTRQEYWHERMKSKAAELSRDQSRARSQNIQQDKDREPKM